MKRRIQKLILLLLFFSFSSMLYAQLPAITSLTIIPANPTTHDIVKVVSESMFPSGGCELNSSNISSYAGNIDVYANHNLGMLTYICNSSDTLSLGMLESGNYNLRYHLSCLPYSTNTDFDSVNFTVQIYMGLDFKENIQQFTLFPNPAEDNITVELPDLLSNAVISFIDLPGREQKSLQTSDKQTIINVKDLAKGIYLIRVQSGDKTGFQKFIKQ